jgi:serine/threonine-protein kinase
MELLQGEPLDKCLDRQLLTVQETAKIIQQVSRGLARAHECGIIHRDLKPENIFLVKTPDDDEAVAKVLDFGIAKDQKRAGASSGGLTSNTKTGAVLGTPFYMSPEQARGLRGVDHRTDVWSLGVIAFRCVTGKLPFDGESMGDVLVKICVAPLPVPSQVQPGISPSFDAWFARALEREPDRRFSSVSELSEALCFAAGIATRSQGNPGALMTPTPGATYPMSNTPGFGSSPRVGSSPIVESAPAPGAMTNAPFTAEMNIPGLPSSRGKILVGVVACAALMAGAFGLVVMMKRPGPAHLEAVNGVVVPTPPPPSAVSVTPPAEPPPPESPPAPAVETKHGAGASTGAKSGKTPSTKGTAKSPPAAPPLPPATPTTATAAPPPPPPPPAPAPTPTTKKVNKNDPGY